MHFEQIDLSASAVQNSEFHPFNADVFIALRHSTKVVRDNTTDGIEVVVLQFGTERFIKIRERRQRLHSEDTWVHFFDVVLFFVEVVLVFDIADYLLEDIFNGNQSGNAAKLVENDRHMIAIGAKLSQQNVQALALWHEYGRAQDVFDIKVVGTGLGQQR